MDVSIDPMNPTAGTTTSFEAREFDPYLRKGTGLAAGAAAARRLGHAALA